MKKYKSKALLSLLGLFAVVLPATTLSSCSTISQYICPIETINHNNGIKVDNAYRDNGRTGDADTGMDQTKWTEPSSYSFKLNFDNSFNPQIGGQYGYTANVKYDWSYENHPNHPFLYDKKSLNDKAWYDPNTIYQSAYDSTNNDVSVDNLMTVGSIIGNNRVSYELINLFRLLNDVQKNIIGHINKDNNDGYKKLGTIIGNNENLTNGNTKAPVAFNFDGDNTWRKQYMTTLYANSVPFSHNEYKFGPYAIDWSLGLKNASSEDLKNISPYVSIENNDSNLVFQKNSIDIDKDHQIYYTNTSYTGQYNWDNDNTKFVLNLDNTKSNNYINYQFGKDGKSDEPNDVLSIANVPVLLSLNNIYNGFYNPSQNNTSYHAADWIYKKDKLKDINDQITASGTWNSITNNNLIHLDQGEKYLDSNIITQQTVSDKVSLTEANKHIDWSNSLTGFASKGSDDIATIKKEPRVKYYIEHNLIQPGTFIGLANISLATLNAKVKHNGEEEQNVTYKIPYFAGYSAVFPSYMLFDANNYATINKDKTGYEHTVLDYDKIVEKNKKMNLKKLMNDLDSRNFNFDDIKPINAASEYDNWTQNKFFIFEWLFGWNDANMFNYKQANVNTSSTNQEFKYFK